MSANEVRAGAAAAALTVRAGARRGVAETAGAGAMLGQTWAQAHLPATRTAVIMSMEPVFAALFAVLLGGESATQRMLFGGALVFAAMLIVELVPRRKIEAEVSHIAV